MKKIAYCLGLYVSLQMGANAQNNKTQNIKVYGECVMCKKRIEKAAFSVEGVQSATWDENTKILTLTYNRSKKTVPENVQQKIVWAGHDTELYTATDAAYIVCPTVAIM